MNGLGSGDNGQFTFLDTIGLISFLIGLQNLELNVGQNDLAEQTQDIDTKAKTHIDNALTEIHSHLEMQDKKLDNILERVVQIENHQETM